MFLTKKWFFDFVSIQVTPVGRNRVKSSAASSSDSKRCQCELCKPKTAIEADQWEKALKINRIKQQQAAKSRAMAEIQRKASGKTTTNDSF